MTRAIVLAWLTGLVLIAVIIAAGTVQLMHAYHLTIARTTERAATKGFLVTEWIAKSFDLTRYVLQDTVKHFDAEELVYPVEDSERHQHQSALLAEKAATVPNLLFLGLLNADCVITHTSIAINLGLDARAMEREYCTLAETTPLAAFKVSNMFVAMQNSMNITASFPLLSPSGQLDGFALAGLDLGFFQRWLDLVEMEEHNVIAIFDLNSRLLARWPLVERQLGERLVDHRLNTLAASGSEMPITFRQASPVDGIERIWSMRKIRDLPFIVVVGEETHTALASWRQQWVLSLIGGALLSLSILFGTHEYVRSCRHAAAMRQLATTDPLTGLANRRAFTEVVTGILARSKRSGAPLALILADLDHFKRINDTFGHDTGDRVLREVAQVMKTLCRQGDLSARWGGEEFVILLPDTPASGAVHFAERLRQQIATLEIAPGQPITLSQGVTLHQTTDRLDDLLKRADAALYRAKEQGRDRLELG